MPSKYILCFFTGLLPLYPVFSQTLLTPEAVVAAALRNNYSILIARNDSLTGAIDESYTYGAFLPRLSATGGVLLSDNYIVQDFAEDSPTPDREGNEIFYTPTASLNLNWTLFDGLKMFATKERIEEIARLGEFTVKNAAVTTVAAVLTTYYNIVRQKQQLRAIEEQMTINAERVKVADRKLSTGLGSKPELLQASVDFNAQRALQLQQQALITQLKEQLDQLAGGQLPDAFEVVDSIPFQTDLRLEDLETGLPDVNPSLILAQRNIGIARLSLEERQAERLPTVALNGSYGLTSRTFQRSVNPFTPTSSSRGFTFGLTATVPILNNMLSLRNIEQAETSIRLFQLQYADQSLQVQTSLRTAYLDYAYQQQALQLEGENISLARENVTIALERFRQGVSTYLELREAQISLEGAYNRLIAARYNAKVAEVELLRLRGALIR